MDGLGKWTQLDGADDKAIQDNIDALDLLMSLTKNNREIRDRICKKHGVIWPNSLEEEPTPPVGLIAALAAFAAVQVEVLHGTFSGRPEGAYQYYTWMKQTLIAIRRERQADNN